MVDLFIKLKLFKSVMLEVLKAPAVHDSSRLKELKFVIMIRS